MNLLVMVFMFIYIGMINDELVIWYLNVLQCFMPTIINSFNLKELKLRLLHALCQKLEFGP